MGREISLIEKRSWRRNRTLKEKLNKERTLRKPSMENKAEK
jgi:hypothetical protein